MSAIILAHCGGGGIFLGEAIVAASLFPNIYLELSSLMPHQVLEVLHFVSSERLMAGSDLPENPMLAQNQHGRDALLV